MAKVRSRLFLATIKASILCSLSFWVKGRAFRRAVRAFPLNVKKEGLVETISTDLENKSLSSFLAASTFRSKVFKTVKVDRLLLLINSVALLTSIAAAVVGSSAAAPAVAACLAVVETAFLL
uniref:Uncharacterized protein n=1 Tax=Romanomermis culicivorax TaxID=13658 RepID=A0A915HQP8_ROMCU